MIVNVNVCSTYIKLLCMLNVMSSLTDPIKSANGHEIDKGKYQGIRGTCQRNSQQVKYLISFF